MRCAKRACVDILEVRYRGTIAGCLIGIGEIDCRHRLQLQRIVAASTIDREFRTTVDDHIVAASSVDHVSAARTIDRVRTQAASNDVGRRTAEDTDTLGRSECACVDILEIRHRHGVADSLVDTSKIDVGGGLQNQRVDARARIDRKLGAEIRNDIVAGAGTNNVGAAAAVDRVIAGTGRDRIGSR